MRNVLIELVDFKNNSLGDHTLHVDSFFNHENLQTYLDSLSSELIKYKFYFLKNKFQSSFNEIIKDFKLEIENKIVIKYEKDESSIPEEELNLDGPIFSLNFVNGKLFVSKYFSFIEIFEKQNKLKRIAIGKNRIRMIYGTIGCTKDGLVVDLEKDTVLFDTKCKDISCLFDFEDKFYFGTESGGCFVVDSEIVEIYRGKSKVVGIFRNEEITFVMQNGEIVVYSTEIESQQLDFCVTSLLKSKNTLVFGTSESFLYCPSTKERVSVSIRYIKGILELDLNILAIYDQYNLVIYDFLNKKNLNQMHFDDEILGITKGDGDLFIAIKNRIQRYEINKLLI
jgi:hypothetical protein